MYEPGLLSSLIPTPSRMFAILFITLGVGLAIKAVASHGFFDEDDDPLLRVMYVLIAIFCLLIAGMVWGL